MSRQFVVIGLEKQKYCIPIELVGGIIDKFSVTDVPNSRGYLKGVTNIRGDIVPVISLKAIFGIAESGVYEGKLLNVFLQGKSVGFVVDTASQVLTVENEDLSRMPALASGGQTYLDMVAKINGDLLIVLDPLELFSEEEKIELFQLMEE